ncbi:DDE superfamily endonuclease [Ceratobasidium sp. AG-Ba]|nr:DDE superfamily endonuclease [Ceratobasidium sp. AG-Ba]
MKSPRSAYMRNYQRHLTWRSQDMCLAALAWVYRRKQIFVILFAGILLSGGIPGTTKLPRERHFLRRSDLMPNPRLDSSWLAIYRNYRDSAFIHTLGINTATFELLLAAGFRDGWDKYTIPRGDVNPNGQSRPGARSLDAEGALAATLYHLCSVVPDKSLEQMFAIVPSSLSRYLSRSVPLLLDVLKSMPEARISWPSRQEMKQSSEIITHRHPNINGAFGFMDGLNLPCQTSGDAGEQSAMFNGWCRAHVVSNVLVFDPKVRWIAFSRYAKLIPGLGMIVAATINAPGSWHDVRVANLDIYRLLLENTPEGFFVIADSAFKSRDEELSKKIHTPLKANSIFENLTDEQVAAEWAYSADITSARQAVEWGMRAIQGCFARLRVPLDANDKLARRHLIESSWDQPDPYGVHPGLDQQQARLFGRLHATLFPESLGREDGIEPFPGGINDTVPAVL